MEDNIIKDITNLFRPKREKKGEKTGYPAIKDKRNLFRLK